MTNQVTDQGLLNTSMETFRKEKMDKILEFTADKGYENGIITHVIADDGKDGYELDILYGEAGADLSSTKPEELKKRLQEDKIPIAYQSIYLEQ